jgi:hypothetical protein
MPLKKGSLARRQSTKKSLVAASGPASYEIPGHLNPEDFKTSYVKETEALLRKLCHARPLRRPLRASSQPPPKGGGATFGPAHVKAGGRQPTTRLGRPVTLGGIGKSAAQRRRSAPPRCVDVFGERDADALPPAHGKLHRGTGQGQAASAGARSAKGHGWMGCSEQGIRQVFASLLKEFVDRRLNPHLRPATGELRARGQAAAAEGEPGAQDDTQAAISAPSGAPDAASEGQEHGEGGEGTDEPDLELRPVESEEDRRRRVNVERGGRRSLSMPPAVPGLKQLFREEDKVGRLLAAAENRARGAPFSPSASGSGSG